MRPDSRARVAGPGQGAGPELQTVARALEVLCCFSCAQPEWGVTEIARYLGTGKSVTHRMVRTLEKYRFLEKALSRRYRLGARTVELGNVYRFDHGMLLKVEPLLRRLALQTSSVAHLGILDGRDVLELARTVGPDSSAFSPHPLYRGPAHATALGKVLLSAMSDRAFEHYVGLRLTLETYTPRTISDPQALRQHLREVAERGYAVDDEERHPGCRCLGVPVKDRSGNTVAALSITSSTAKFGWEVFPLLLPKLVGAAAAIRAQL